MAVRIRLKRLGRRHRSYFRLCAIDQRTPRDGRVLEELGSYDPSLSNVNARAVLNGERIQYWLSVGAQPSEKVRVLIKKYGAEGTHLDQQRVALEELAQPRTIPDPGPAASKPASEASSEESPAATAVAEKPAEEAEVSEEPAAGEPAAAEEATPKAEASPAEASEPSEPPKPEGSDAG